AARTRRARYEHVYTFAKRRDDSGAESGREILEVSGAEVFEEFDIERQADECDIPEANRTSNTQSPSPDFCRFFRRFDRSAACGRVRSDSQSHRAGPEDEPGTQGLASGA